MKRIYVEDKDGTKTDITEGVQAMYVQAMRELLRDSLDRGSGMICPEDALPLVALARTAGFEAWEEVERYVRSMRGKA